MVSHLIAKTIPTNKRVKTFIDQVIIFENQLKGFKKERDLTTLVDYGEENISVMERVIKMVVRGVKKAMNKGINGEKGGLPTWSNGLIALTEMANALVECKTKEVTSTLKTRMYDELADAMLLLVPVISNFKHGLTPGQLAATSTVRLRIMTLQDPMEKDGISLFRVIRVRMDEVFGLNEWRMVIPSIGSTELTVSNVAKLPRDDKCQDQPKYLDSSSDYDYDYESES
jgi:hypothetical protein